ncbi:hypothetical protein GF339_18130 [candidate division KSB3 bacterium]|uniref:Uncharacterized protein n=1 Tax=candidate division KSB3 bacterium TaxID=2044937 RepID=A0A9D5JYK8_9BACT|nr:hypothetical protein [candidate division KSB3 bacterium]MBD3326508.1 hypothetical protein [candidate division KSB3 bacterium]
MYQPKLKDEYIPLLYREARRRSMYMTTLLNEIVDEYFARLHAHPKQGEHVCLTEDSNSYGIERSWPSDRS